MLVKILGVFDIFVAIILFLVALNMSISTKLIIFLIVVLAIKSIPNLLSFCIGSIIDAIVIIILIVCIFTTPPAFVLFVAAFAIAQKGAVSFL